VLCTNVDTRLSPEVGSHIFGAPNRDFLDLVRRSVRDNGQTPIHGLFLGFRGALLGVGGQPKSCVLAPGLTP